MYLFIQVWNGQMIFVWQHISRESQQDKNDDGPENGREFCLKKICKVGDAYKYIRRLNTNQ